MRCEICRKVEGLDWIVVSPEQQRRDDVAISESSSEYDRLAAAPALAQESDGGCTSLRHGAHHDFGDAFPSVISIFSGFEGAPVHVLKGA